MSNPVTKVPGCIQEAASRTLDWYAESHQLKCRAIPWTWASLPNEAEMAIDNLIVTAGGALAIAWVIWYFFLWHRRQEHVPGTLNDMWEVET